MNIGLYFGSFNPIHVGHLIIANFIANTCDINQVWFVVSPQNPFKTSTTLLNEYHRLHLVRLATENNVNLKVSDVEFKLPRPSYTIDTLTYLNERYPTYKFSVIVGSDSFQNIKRWKNGELLLKNYEFIVYNRPGNILPGQPNTNVQILEAPLLDISATMIRNFIKNRQSIQYLLPENVRDEIELNNYYK